MKITEMISSEKKLLPKKKLKRFISSESVKVLLPKRCLKAVREIILMINNDRELTEGEKECLEDINKHLATCNNETD